MSVSTHLWLGSTSVSGSTTNEREEGLASGVPASLSSTVLIYTSGVVLSSDSMSIYTHCLISCAYGTD